MRDAVKVLFEKKFPTKNSQWAKQMKKGRVKKILRARSCIFQAYFQHVERMDHISKSTIENFSSSFSSLSCLKFMIFQRKTEVDGSKTAGHFVSSQKMRIFHASFTWSLRIFSFIDNQGDFNEQMLQPSVLSMSSLSFRKCPRSKSQLLNIQLMLCQ